MVHSSSGLGRRPLTPETRVRLPDALLKSNASSHSMERFFIFVQLKAISCLLGEMYLPLYDKKLFTQRYELHRITLQL